MKPAMLLKESPTPEELSPPERIHPENGEDFKLEELYKLLECELVEVVAVPHRNYILIVDEEGLLRDRKINHLASAWGGQRIVGHAVLCHATMFK